MRHNDNGLTVFVTKTEEKIMKLFLGLAVKVAGRLVGEVIHDLPAEGDEERPALQMGGQHLRAGWEKTVQFQGGGRRAAGQGLQQCQLEGGGGSQGDGPRLRGQPGLRAQAEPEGDARLKGERCIRGRGGDGEIRSGGDHGGDGVALFTAGQQQEAHSHRKQQKQPK